MIAIFSECCITIFYECFLTKSIECFMILLLIFVLKFSHRHPPHQYQQEIWVRLKLRLNLYVSEGFTNMHINIQWYTGFKRILKSLKGVCVNNCHDDNVKDLDKEQLMTIIMQTDICMVLINDMVKKNYYDDDKFSCVISDLLCNESNCDWWWW